MKTKYLSILLVLITINAFPQTSTPSTQEKKPCPNAEHMSDSLCIAISGRQKDSTGEFDFHYQKIIHEAACVNKNDSEEEKIRKIQKMWKTLEDVTICNSTEFSVQDGSIVKLAVEVLSDDFIFDVTDVWKVDLNKVDKWDNRTVLDFVRDEIERHRGSAIEGTLRSYYNQLRAAGAKHGSEL